MDVLVLLVEPRRFYFILYVSDVTNSTSKILLTATLLIFCKHKHNMNPYELFYTSGKSGKGKEASALTCSSYNQNSSRIQQRLYSRSGKNLNFHLFPKHIDYLVRSLWANSIPNPNIVNWLFLSLEWNLASYWSLHQRFLLSQKEK